MENLNVVFMGTPEFSVNTLKELIKNTKVILVVTMPDAQVGRKKILTSSPVKNIALAHDIPVFQPDKISKDFQIILDYKPDIIITCAYGQFIPSEILKYPKYGCINIHASLLPKYRGGAPIYHAIKNGDEFTGITIMNMEEKMDAGDILYQGKIKIENNDTLGSLSNKLSILGSEMIIKYLPSIIKGDNPQIKQNEKDVTYAPIIKREDELLYFNDKAINIYNKVRALNPEPLAYISILGHFYKIVECEVIKSKGLAGIISEVNKDYFVINALNGGIKITKIKPEGKNIMTVKDYFNGFDRNQLLGCMTNER